MELLQLETKNRKTNSCTEKEQTSKNFKYDFYISWVAWQETLTSTTNNQETITSNFEEKENENVLGRGSKSVILKLCLESTCSICWLRNGEKKNRNLNCHSCHSNSEVHEKILSFLLFFPQLLSKQTEG